MELFKFGRIKVDLGGRAKGGRGRLRTVARRAAASFLAVGAISLLSVAAARADEPENASTALVDETAVPVAETTISESNSELAAGDAASDARSDERSDDRSPPHYRRPEHRFGASRHEGPGDRRFGDHRHGPRFHHEDRFSGRGPDEDSPHRGGPHGAGPYRHERGDFHDHWRHARYEESRSSHHHRDSHSSEDLLRRLIEEVSQLRQEVHQLHGDHGSSRSGSSSGSSSGGSSSGRGLRGSDRVGPPEGEGREMRHPPAGPPEGARGERHEGPGRPARPNDNRGDERRGPPGDRPREGGPSRQRPANNGPPRTGSNDIPADRDDSRPEPRATIEKAAIENAATGEPSGSDPANDSK